MEAYDHSGQSMALAGPSRAAILLLALGPSGAGRLLKHFSHDEIRAIRQGAAGQPAVSSQELEIIVSQFQDAFQVGAGLSALDLQMQKLLKETLSEEEMVNILGSAAGLSTDLIPEPAMWPKFEEQGAEALQALLSLEHPQIVAVVLTRLSADLAALVVAGLETSLRNDILSRMLSAQQLSPMGETVFEVAFREVHLSSGERQNRSARHVGFAEIVNRMEKTQADELLASIGQTQPDDIAAVRRLLFAFEDLPTLPRRSLLVLFDEVPSETVTTALQGAEAELKEAVLSSLAARARRMVESELSQPRSVDAGEIASARRSIAALALRLAGEGRIALTPAADG